MSWHCESCDSEQPEAKEPAYEEKHTGHRETVLLWFCEGCVQ